MQAATRLAQFYDPSNDLSLAEQQKRQMLAVAVSADKGAFADLFCHFAPRVKSLMLKSGASDTEAEDIAQEVMLRVWRKCGQYHPARGAVSTWIFTIARNIRIDRLRGHSSAPYEDIDDHDIVSEETGAEEDMLVRQHAEIVSAALAQLPGEQREVIELAFIKDKPQSEIAVELNLPMGTVKSRMRLAYAKLRQTLEILK